MHGSHVQMYTCRDSKNQVTDLHTFVSDKALMADMHTLLDDRIELT